MATAADVVAPYWQVFEPPMIDKSTTEFEYVEYQQRGANQMDKPDGGQYTIATRVMDAYLSPHKADAWSIDQGGWPWRLCRSGNHIDKRRFELLSVRKIRNE